MGKEFSPQLSSPEIHISEPLQIFADLFVQRWDTYGRQIEHQRQYYRVRDAEGKPEPLTWDTIVRHLRGEMTIGLYSIDKQGLTRWTAIDGDHGVGPLLNMQKQLKERGIHGYLELSRVGGHLWVWWDRPIRPDLARNILQIHDSSLALYPAGDIPDEAGTGLLIRAPLGVHQFTGRRYPFVHKRLRAVSPGIARGQLDWLAKNVQPVNPFQYCNSLLTQELPLPSTVIYRPDVAKPIAAWVAENDIREVIRPYVTLSYSGRGRCPWPGNHKHRDMHPSFAVYERTQKWWCFTERMGGNAFDFLCRYYGKAAGDMLKELYR